MEPASTTSPLTREELDFLMVEFSSLRQELASRWTSLYALGTLTWVVVAGAFAAIYAIPKDPFYPLALFVVPIVLLLAVVFGGEVAWLSALHRACAQIEERVIQSWPPEHRPELRRLLWHTRFGTYFIDFPGAKTMLGGAALLLATSVVALAIPLDAALGARGLGAVLQGAADLGVFVLTAWIVFSSVARARVLQGEMR